VTVFLPEHITGPDIIFLSNSRIEQKSQSLHSSSCDHMHIYVHEDVFTLDITDPSLPKHKLNWKTENCIKDAMLL